MELASPKDGCPRIDHEIGSPYCFSADPDRRGAATGFKLPVTSVRLSAGAGFVVALTGEIMTMPGLPRVPAAEHIDVDDSGEIVGLS